MTTEESLLSIQSAIRFLISEMDDAVDKGLLKKRRDILKEIFILKDKERQLIKELPTPQETNFSTTYIEKEIKWIDEEMTFLIKLGYSESSREIELLKIRKETLNREEKYSTSSKKRIMSSKYNENLGKKPNASPLIDNSDVFSQLPELENLKRMKRITEGDILRGIGDKEILIKNIEAFDKRIAEIESTINKSSFKVEETQTIVTTANFHSSPKVEDKYKTEYIERKNSSTWKKIDFSGKTSYEPPKSEALKEKKPWWKFW